MNDRVKMDILSKGYVTKEDVLWFMAEERRERLARENPLRNSWHRASCRRGRNAGE